MCEFCAWIRNAETERDYSRKYIRRWESGTFDLFLGSGGSWDSGELKDIKFCPMCGRKLTDKENTVEMKPVIHAHAIIDWLGNPKCSNCGDVGINASEPYCQHCGARLDEPEEMV